MGTKADWREAHAPAPEHLCHLTTAELQEELDMVKFRVSPKMNKIEMKEWIETAYDTPVKKVLAHPPPSNRACAREHTHTHLQTQS